MCKPVLEYGKIYPYSEFKKLTEQMTKIIHPPGLATINCIDKTNFFKRDYMKKIRILLTLALLLFSATQSLAAEDKHTSAHSHGESHGTAQESDFTLKEVMEDLAFSLSRIEYGILANNRLMIKEGAKGIAHHPNPKGGLKPYIKKKTAGLDNVIAKMDKLVHDTAVETAKGADSEPMLKLQAKADKITKACVGCHNAFRD
jgi:hypothetical protein